jgi:hypothetical protein
MTEASDAAYAEAQRLIAAAKASSATRLDLSTEKTRALTALPPEIAQLISLTTLDLSGTDITDISPLTSLTALTTLELHGILITDLSPCSHLTGLTTLLMGGSSVMDLSPLSNLTSLTELEVWDTHVADLSPLGNLTALTSLMLSGTRISDLSALAHLTALRSLYLTDTSITDLSPLIRLTALTTLYVSGTKVTDLSPLRHLTGLLWPSQIASGDPDPGLYFSRTPACDDPRVAAIAEIEDDALRARTLFDHLQNLRRFEYSAPAGASELLPPSPSHMRAPTLLTAINGLTTAQLTQVLADSYPDLQARTAHLVDLIQQEQAVHALIPTPNSDDALAEHRKKAMFLQTLLAGLISLAAELPENAASQALPDPTTLKKRLQSLAKTLDQSIAYLDSHEGTYGSLRKLGLVSGCAGLLGLWDVPFVTSAAVAGGAIYVQNLSVKLLAAKK